MTEDKRETEDGEYIEWDCQMKEAKIEEENIETNERKNDIQL